MTCAFAHLRILVSVLVLGMTIAVGMAPGAAFAVNCDDALIASHDGAVASTVAATAHLDNDGDQRTESGGCRTSCTVAHCCASDVPAIGDQVAVANFTTTTWHPRPTGTSVGLGPFGEFRPPRRIG
jgi:hypothetical protein